MSQNAEVQSYLYESLNGIATVKALNSEEIVNVEYEKKKMTAIETGWTLNRYGISQGLISGLINGISGILVYWIGCPSILDGLMSFGTLITFNSLLVQSRFVPVFSIHNFSTLTIPQKYVILKL